MPKKPLSEVAGILELGGGCRIVVAEPGEPWRFACHVQPGERLFVVPNLLVTYPVEWDSIPWLVARVEQHVADSIYPEELKRRGVPVEEAEHLLGRRIVRKGDLSEAA